MTPTSGFAAHTEVRWNKYNEFTSMPRDHRLCFPWAVVELKKSESKNDNGSTLSVYSHAANAASTALCMLKNLSKFAKANNGNIHIPPVMAITCVGGKTNVWLMYSRHDGDNQRDHVSIYRAILLVSHSYLIFVANDLHLEGLPL